MPEIKSPEHFIPTIAVIIPCYNEEATISNVVRDFVTVLPGSHVYVYDNNSTDKSVENAKKAGALVRHEKQQGKGNVVRRAFADVDADIYVLVDGDDTYDARSAPRLVAQLLNGPYDMINASRVEKSELAYRKGHRFGNWAISTMIGVLFGKSCNDVLSGYRVFSKRFVKSFPALARGFEIETELTVHALQLRMPVAETQTPYKERPEGSVSKLSTFKDGFRILFTILYLLKEEKPLMFFSIISFVLLLGALILGVPVIEDFMKTGLVPRLPSAVLATGLVILSSLGVACGMILDSLTRARLELKRLTYLRHSAPHYHD
ncbi:MAG: glycosyltransferase family 2 protein [Alphaproteobacteria bacterium]|nr:glycosyltransferase family 2 protein [Alphaproteobacteria bacterium]